MLPRKLRPKVGWFGSGNRFIYSKSSAIANMGLRGFVYFRVERLKTSMVEMDLFQSRKWKAMMVEIDLFQSGKWRARMVEMNLCGS